ncbi:hypothetical protein BCR32DRAFT_282248 [Anaeromyces robustus]|uniref:WSC domain-containing protein n=1 Tax=Anaeromyces robustus TaxID=1754192 RepID=A0A1Y1WY24_9FUNG|nr:hypothetical protein BCR32DRAFT_282248 [Anaeromyces robustus]|eukprot:ORX78451.1 hypothetical protein BCR32DRAFT_282248 [Anaeromyces robustus]
MNLYRSTLFLVLFFLSLVVISVNATWTESECRNQWTRRLYGQDVNNNYKMFTPSSKFINAACEDKTVCRLGWSSWNKCCKRMCRKGEYKRFKIIDNQTSCTCYCNRDERVYITLCTGKPDQTGGGEW